MITLPDHKGRMPTGPVQFGDDWPGYFFRGDDAFALANVLDKAAQTAMRPYAAELRRYAEELRQCGAVR